MGGDSSSYPAWRNPSKWLISTSHQVRNHSSSDQKSRRNVVITFTQDEGKFIAKLAKGFFFDNDLELENEIEMQEALKRKLEGTRFLKEEKDWSIFGKTVLYHPIDWKALQSAIQSGEIKVIWFLASEEARPASELSDTAQHACVFIGRSDVKVRSGGGLEEKRVHLFTQHFCCFSHPILPQSYRPHPVTFSYISFKK